MQRVTLGSVPLGNNGVGAGIHYDTASPPVLTLLLLAQRQPHVLVLQHTVFLTPQLVGASNQGLEIFILVEVAGPVGWMSLKRFKLVTRQGCKFSHLLGAKDIREGGGVDPGLGKLLEDAVGVDITGGVEAPEKQKDNALVSLLAGLHTLQMLQATDGEYLI